MYNLNEIRLRRRLATLRQLRENVNDDAPARGGESGKSCIEEYISSYTTIDHVITLSRFLKLPAAVCARDVIAQSHL